MAESAARPRVLLVDDLEPNLIALDANLSKMDCDLVHARSGNEALRQLLKREFAVMLLDVQMPEMDGYEVAKYARENPATSDVPIIFVTANHETEESLLRAYGTGAVDFLFKPINPYILRSKVQVFLDLYSNRRQLAMALEDHRRTQVELEAFTYSVSHDLRAPLRHLQGFSRSLLEDYESQLDAAGKDYLGRIQRAATRMNQLIEDLLRLSRIGQSSLDLKPLDLAEVAQTIAEELKRMDPARTVEFECVSPAPVLADPGLMRILLENLLRNAWKFSSKKDSAKVRFGRRVEQGEAVYFVEDNGVGFDPEFARKLFQPFQRLHSDKEFEGTGIGLAIVGRIVSHHRGKVWAQSTPGAGATFCFTLGIGER